MERMAICKNAHYLDILEKHLVNAEDALDCAMNNADIIHNEDGRCPAFVEHDLDLVREKIRNMRADVAFYKEACNYRYNVESAGADNNGGWF